MQIKILIALSGATLLIACENNDSEYFAEQSSAIMNGIADASHHAVAAVHFSKPGRNIWAQMQEDAQKEEREYALGVVCTATLIGKDTMITAGHCIDYAIRYNVFDKLSIRFIEDANKTVIPHYRRYSVKNGYVHPNYVFAPATHDIAIIRLDREVDSQTAQAMPLMTKEMAVDSVQLKAKNRNYPAVISGFGFDEKDKNGKRKITAPSMAIYGYCPALSPTADDTCLLSTHTLLKHYNVPVKGVEDENIEVCPNCYVYENKRSGPCAGDSGGPLFITKDGVEYLAAITSSGDRNCEIFGLSVAVWPYADNFIDNVLNKDRCANTLDDNHNGKIDCEDDECKESAHCQEVKPEICDNTIDDDKDGKVDCDDADCKSFEGCQVKPEICDNTIDDDKDGKVDCDDADCKSFEGCQVKPEICDNTIDDDKDGKIDCDDEDCDCKKPDIPKKEEPKKSDNSSCSVNILRQSGGVTSILGLFFAFALGALRRRKNTSN